MRSSIRLILGWLVFVFVICFAIMLSPGGAANFQFFINLEAMLVLFGGTFIWGWMSWGLKAMFKAIFVGLTSPSPYSSPIKGEDNDKSPSLIAREGGGEGAKAKTVLSGLRNAALSLSVAGTILGMILMLGTIDDIAQVPKKFAIALTSAFYGILLAEVFSDRFWQELLQREKPFHLSEDLFTVSCS